MPSSSLEVTDLWWTWLLMLMLLGYLRYYTCNKRQYPQSATVLQLFYQLALALKGPGYSMVIRLLDSPMKRRIKRHMANWE